MNRAKRLTLVLLTLAVALGTASAQQFIIKERRFAVAVEENAACSRGIAVSGDSLAGRHLCADYPEGVAELLHNFVGSTVAIEAMWTFLPDPNDQAPVALGGITMIGKEKIGGERVDNPCAFDGMVAASVDAPASCDLSAAVSGKSEVKGPH
jgi:hypothetical protein